MPLPPPHPEPPAPTFGVISLGCDKNTVDTERYLATLTAHGVATTDDLGQADVILVNTCGFIDAAKRESIDALVEAGRLKATGRCRGVVAIGCMVERHRQELAAALPEVDLFLGTSDADQLVPTLRARGWLASAVPRVHPGVRVFAGGLPHVRYLKVSEGCDHGCAFCAIPLMRGRHRSFSLDDVVREAQLLEMQGAREVNLVAQDLAHYGRDRHGAGVGLPELLQALLAHTDIPWIRLLYVYAAGLNPRVLSLLASEARLVKYLDMPIQHGSDVVLARMRRPERAATIRATVARVRDAVPTVALRTTCIVGFPGETEDDVARLLDLLEEVAFERVGVFAYSAQDGTRAATFADDVPDAVKRERVERVTERQRLITAERYERRLGTLSPAIIDRVVGRPGDDALVDMDTDVAEGTARIQARLACQADDIDGVTMVDGADLVPGSIVEIELEDIVNDYDFRGSVRRVLSTPAPSRRASRGRALPLAGDHTTAGSFGR